MLVPRLRTAGIDIVVYAVGHVGAPLVMDGITILGRPDTLTTSASEMIDIHADRHGCDMVITVKDPYAFLPEAMRELSIPWVAMCPVDTEPISEMNARILNYATGVIAVTRRGKEEIERTGAMTAYAPHGVDTKVFCSGSKAASRKELGLRASENTFIALVVGDNHTNPSRKNFENIIPAWGQWVRTHSDSLLVLHTLLTEDRGGVDIDGLIKAYDVPASSIFVTDQYDYLFGKTPQYMAKMYRAADVLLMPSCGEGFGIPLIEAQACGTPVIVTDWSSMPEVTVVGVTIPTAVGMAGNGSREMTPFGGFHYRASREAILMAMEAVVDRRYKPEELVAASNVIKSRYDIDTVVREHWVPMLDGFEKILFKGVLDGIRRVQQEDNSNKILQERAREY
jgi:glycosyltransferase involved in cell wall biosynthesis